MSNFEKKFRRAVELEDVEALQEIFSKHRALKVKRDLDKKYSQTQEVSPKSIKYLPNAIRKWKSLSIAAMICIIFGIGYFVIQFSTKTTGNGQVLALSLFEQIENSNIRSQANSQTLFDTYYLNFEANKYNTIVIDYQKNRQSYYQSHYIEDIQFIYVLSKLILEDFDDLFKSELDMILQNTEHLYFNQAQEIASITDSL